MLSRKRRRRHLIVVAKLFEHAAQDWFDSIEYVVLRDVGHFQVKLIEFPRGTIGPSVFVAEARRDLKVLVEARNHQQLLKLLRCLRQRVEFARMLTRWHQVIARALRRRRSQYWRLNFQESLIGHAPSNGGNDLGAQNNVVVGLFPAQVQEPILQSDLFAELLISGYLHGQHFGWVLNNNFADTDLHLTGIDVGVDRILGARDHGSGHGQNAFRTGSLNNGEQLAGNVDHTLRQAEMVPQIDENEVSVITLAVYPTRQTYRLVNMFFTQFYAGVCSVGVHGFAHGFAFGILMILLM